jgi:hypothetical protein
MSEIFKSYAGTVEYHPRHILSDEKRKQLRQRLLTSGLVSAPENGEILIDWYLAETDPAGATVHQTYVVLYLDGGDAEPPACIFYRLDRDRLQGSTLESTCIPSATLQPELILARRWWEDPSGKKLDTLVNAFNDLLHQPVWETLTSNAD